MTKEKYCYWDNSDERLYIDMRPSKEYTNELEKLTCNDGVVTITIKLKQAAAKKWDLGLLLILRLNIDILAPIKAISWHEKIIV